MLGRLRAASRRMTTIISGLVILSIILSVGAVSATIFVTLRNQAVSEGQTQQQANLRVAATILERRINNAKVIWSDDGEMTAFRTLAAPDVRDVTAIDAVVSVTKQQAMVM